MRISARRIEEMNGQTEGGVERSQGGAGREYQRARKRVDVENLAPSPRGRRQKSALEERAPAEMPGDRRGEPIPQGKGGYGETPPDRRARPGITTTIPDGPSRRLTEDWQAKTAARNEAHAKCLPGISTDKNSPDALGVGKAMNAPWLNEESVLKTAIGLRRGRGQSRAGSRTLDQESDGDAVQRKRSVSADASWRRLQGRRSIRRPFAEGAPTGFR